MEHVTEGCTCGGRKCAMCEETKCYGRFKVPTTFNCIGCQKAYQKGYQKAYQRKPNIDKSEEEPKPKVRFSSAEYNVKWRKEHPEEWKAWGRQYRQATKGKRQERAAVDEANYRARKMGVEGVILLQEWLDLKRKYDDTCLSCGSTNVKLTIDHIVPLERGGTNYIDNIQPLCMPCNSKKHAKTIDFRPKKLDRSL